MPIATLIGSRKERRKQGRRTKRKRIQQNTENEAPKKLNEKEDAHAAPKLKKAKNELEKKPKAPKAEKKNDPYSHLDPQLADAIRRDDEEIAALEAKLGLGKGKANKSKLNKEYAKLEGYGDDFGNFLDDLDQMVYRDASGVTKKDDDDDDECAKDSSDHDDDDDSDGEAREIKSNYLSEYDADVAAALERDDQEIAELERKLALGNKKNKSKLFNEYKREGYGDEFGDFLEGLDDMMMRVRDTKKTKDYEARLANASESDEDRLGSDDDVDMPKDSDDDSEASEEIVPMKDPEYDDLDEDDSVLEELERHEKSSLDVGSDDEESDIGDDSDSAMEESSDADEVEDDVGDTYRPSKGEDIYGNKIETDEKNHAKPSKYVPPHLRNKSADESQDEEKRRAIRCGLNNALNRLSDDTLVSVSQQLAQLYSMHPTQMVHEMLWKNTIDACVLTPILMKGLIPTYMACVVGVHIQTSDTVQVGEFVLEAVVTELWRELESFRNRKGEEDISEQTLPSEIVSKHICNRMLILCYLYNYNVVHCSLMYDVIRHLIENFSEVDIECLLLLLSHCGRSLRSDDPLALKEIVLLVQKQNAQVAGKEGSSRAAYMVSAITDLKNNKRGKQDTAYGEKTAKLRKILGQIKSMAAKSNTAKTSSEASLRISLQDILDVDEKGRWWKVGASWVGNQYRFNDTPDAREADSKKQETSHAASAQSKEDQALTKLASKLRMNTDRKRAIFFIIMGSEDCEDAFEKLCRGSMLQNRSERDACRVLLECCLEEKSYNKFYGHLAARMVEFQPQCKFSLQLAFWDTFKQFDTVDVRKAANLAKFLFHLIVTHQVVRLMTVIKAMDISEDDMEESAMIFLTILMSNILDHFQDTLPIKDMFGSRQVGHDDPSRQEQEEGVRASLLVFFMETLKASPKNIKGSTFRKNFKAAVKALDTDGFEGMF